MYSHFWTYLNILIRHSDVISIGGQILWRSHHRELDGSLVSEGLVCPFSHRSNLFDGRNTVVRNENLESVLLANIPRFVSFLLLTDVMTECPSPCATNSLTALEGAALNLFPPMKCEASSCLSCQDLEALALWPLTPFVAGAMIIELDVYHARVVRCRGLGARARGRSE